LAESCGIGPPHAEIAMSHRFKILRPIHVSASFHKQMILLAIAINKGSGRNTL
jgi:hypothetical protein